MNNNDDDTDLSIDNITPVTYNFKNPHIPTGAFTSIGVAPTGSLAAGSNGTVLTTGSNGIDWSSLPYTINTASTNSWTGIVNNNITLNGEGADIRVNGKSLAGAIDAIEQRLAILHPNPEIEKEWEELRQLGDQYRKLEAEIKAKIQVWDVLKKTDI